MSYVKPVYSHAHPLVSMFGFPVPPSPFSPSFPFSLSKYSSHMHYCKTAVFVLSLFSVLLLFLIYSYKNSSFSNALTTASFNEGSVVGAAKARDGEVPTSAAASKLQSITNDSTANKNRILNSIVLLRFSEELPKRFSFDIQNMIKKIMWDGRKDDSKLRLEGRISSYNAACHVDNLSKEAPSKSISVSFIKESFSPAPLEGSPAVAGLPCMLYLSNSSIPGAHLGVFSKFPLKRGLLFGPYKGELKSTDNKDDMSKSGYSWALGFNDTHYLYVDASNESQSNWLRFANCPRFEEEQNLVPVIVQSQVYYYLYKDIVAGAELLIYYGNGYAAELGLWSATDITPEGFAPPRSQVACPICVDFPTPEEVRRRFQKPHIDKPI